MKKSIISIISIALATTSLGLTLYKAGIFGNYYQVYESTNKAEKGHYYYWVRVKVWRNLHIVYDDSRFSSKENMDSTRAQIIRQAKTTMNDKD